MDAASQIPNAAPRWAAVACLLWLIVVNCAWFGPGGQSFFRLPTFAPTIAVERRQFENSPSMLPSPIVLHAQPPVDSVFPFSQTAFQNEEAVDDEVRNAAEDAPSLPPASFPVPPEPLPTASPTPRSEVLPVENPLHRERIQISLQNDRLTLTAREAPLSAILGMIAQQHGLNIITGADVNEQITVTLTNVQLTDALDAILGVNGYTWTMQRNILVVTPIDGTRKSGHQMQGRIVRVLPLNYVAADDIDKVVKGLLSPVGQSFTRQTLATDQRRTHEQIVIEDLPLHVQRIADYICAVDHQPRQVLIEAHVLQVQLKDDCKHGVNFEQLLRVANADITLETAGFANPAAVPASFFRIEGTDLNLVLEALKSTTDSKTLASPKVAVLNGQEARLQVGGQIGYLTTTTTETTAVQTVNFLNTGVIMLVTPIITADGQVLMTIKPQVSSGRINPTTSLPETETTEVETRVMLADGEAVVIGGLIKEIDNEIQNKIPYLGDVKYVGRIFQRRTITRERSEVIIALLPRIMCPVPGSRQFDGNETQRARTPLFSGPLTRVDRSAWEPLLPDATIEPRSPAPAVVEYGPSQLPIEESPGPFQLPPPAFPVGLDTLPPPAAIVPPVNQPPVIETQQRPQPAPSLEAPTSRRSTTSVGGVKPTYRR